MPRIRASGDYKKADHYFEKILEVAKLGELNKYGREGESALASATPTRTGETAASWSYEIERGSGSSSISWSNSHTNKGVNIALLLQYGHGTGTGGYVPGTDYINPAISPVMDKITDGVWREITES